MLLASAVLLAGGAWAAPRGEAQTTLRPPDVLAVAEGDEQRPKGAKDKEEAKRDTKGAGKRFKENMRGLGGKTKQRWQKSKDDVKDPKHRGPRKKSEGSAA